MASESTAGVKSFFDELLRFSVYKRSQGKVARQVTFGILLAVLLIGVWRLNVVGWISPPAANHSVTGVLLVLSGWISFRLVNIPKFADFLISVEAEMTKVSWPSRDELIRSSAVVMFTIFALAGLILAYDVIWQLLFRWLGVRV